MVIIRLILFLGLIFHKVVWEMLKKRDGAPKTEKPAPKSPLKSAVKLGKASFLGFLLLQTLFLNLFPISNQPTILRIIGLTIYFIGLATAITGRLQLGKNWANLEDYQFLPKQSLVSKGIYRYIRHPIYTGDILLIVGLELTLNSWLVFMAILPLLVVFKQAVAEEALLAQVLPGYSTYCRQTKRFIPFII
jgi:protein-S-isoprenylcysteine O-methyltransferase Ste14